MKDWNEWTATGRLTKDPEMSRTEKGACRAKFTLAVNRGKEKSGKDKGAFFFRCQAWGRLAEIVGQYAAKGKRVLVRGRLFATQYKKDGQDVTFTGINVDDFVLMDAPRKKTEEETLAENKAAFEAYNDPGPKPPKPSGNPDDRADGSAVNDYPEDIPF